MKKILNLKNKSIFSLFFVISMLLIYLYAIYRIYSADVCYEKSVSAIEKGIYYDALEKASCAIANNPLEPNYYRGRAKVLILIAASLQREDIGNLKNQARADLETAYMLNPSNLVTIRNSVPLYYYLAINDYSKQPGSDNWDIAYIKSTRDFYTEVKTTYVHDAGVISLIAKYEKKLGLHDEYESSRQLIKNLRPDLLEWHEAFR